MNYDNMSASLKKSLGLQVKEETKTDWKPPSRAGLQNSTPILMGGKVVSNMPSNLAPSNAFGENYEATYEEDTEDEDEELEEREDDDENYQRSSAILANMSPNLMRVLGLSAPTIESDWKPPAFSGLGNSSPIRSNR